MALACGTRNSDRIEAQALLERISRLDPKAPYAGRAREIEALRALPLQTEALRNARDACVTAHEGLLEAERKQASVRALLDQPGPTTVREPAELARLSAELAQANQLLERADGALPRCQQQARDLLLRRP